MNLFFPLLLQLLLVQVISEPCNIDVVSQMDPSFTRIVQSHVHSNTPLIITDSPLDIEVHEVTSKELLMDKFSDYEVVLSSANTNSYEKRVETFQFYMENMLSPVTLSQLANETWYFFGNNKYDEWSLLFDMYTEHLPDYFFHFIDSIDQISYSFGIGSTGSGTPMHVHGPVLAQALHGRKRWFLYNPETVEAPPFIGNETSTYWLHNFYPHLIGNEVEFVVDGVTYSKPSSQLFECVCNPGDVLWLPTHWWHSTLNLDPYTSFMSAFI